MYRLYTDGSYSDVSGVGSWAWLLLGGTSHQVGSGAVEGGGVTHHGMELRAAVEGLRRVPAGAEVELVSDSTYVTDGLELGYGPRSPAYHDLWAELAALAAVRTVTFTWVKAHNGDGSDPWNVMTDHVAKTARRLLEGGAEPGSGTAQSGIVAQRLCA